MGKEIKKLPAGNISSHHDFSHCVDPFDDFMYMRNDINTFKECAPVVNGKIGHVIFFGTGGDINFTEERNKIMSEGIYKNINFK